MVAGEIRAVTSLILEAPWRDDGINYCVCGTIELGRPWFVNKDKHGSRRRAEVFGVFMRWSCYGATAKGLMSMQVKEGDFILVQGSIVSEKWVSPTGRRSARNSIRATNVTMLHPPPPRVIQSRKGRTWVTKEDAELLKSLDRGILTASDNFDGELPSHEDHETAQPDDSL